MTSAGPSARAPTFTFAPGVVVADADAMAASRVLEAEAFYAPILLHVGVGWRF